MQETKRQPRRDEIPQEFKWDLSELYPSVEDWEQAVQEVEALIPRLASYQGRLAEAAATLLEALQLSDAVGQRLSRIVAYARLNMDTDTTNQTFQALHGRAMDLATRVRTAQAYMNPEILAIDEETLRRFLAENEALRLYEHALNDIRRVKDHVLSAEVESILSQASEMARAPHTVFTMVNNADMKFPTIRDEDGAEVELTHARYIRFMKSRRRDVRQAAFKALYSAYDKQKNTIAALLNASVKKDVFYARVRRYNSALEHALDGDNIPVSVYDNLIETVRKNLHLMHRYVRLRKRALQLDELHMYDLYAPLVPDVEFKIPFAEAKELVAEGLQPLGPEYVRQLRAGMDGGWLDVYENAGKASGAYSYGIYGHHPYVLLNHQDTLDSTFTLAHEMGHAMHSYYSTSSQPFVYAHYSIFVAEVASTVNESLLMHHLLNTTTEKEKRMYLLNHYLEEFRGTVFRQTMFAEFERWTHEMAEKGQTLTPGLLMEYYGRLNEEYHGPDMVVDPEIRLEWARIPHFYRPFYVYQYATGFCAATALTRQILTEGAPAVERYLAFLRAGNSDYSLNLLRAAGVDMTTPAPIQAGMDVFAELLDELERLIG